MAEVHIVDIDGEQWDMKDLPLTQRVAAFEEKTTNNFEYSTTEQEIGKWIDGKKHYRMVITGYTLIHNARIELANKNIKDITKISGMCNASGIHFFPIPYFYLNQVENIGKYFTYSYYNIENKEIRVRFGEAEYFDNVTFSIEIEYTKNS